MTGKATTTTKTTTMRVAATKSLAVELGVALILSACSHAAVPPPRSANGNRPISHNQISARQEVRTGVQAYGHHAYKIALSHFTRALTLDPRSVEALYDRGLTEEKLNAYKRAESDLHAVVRARPQWPSARLHLAAAGYHAHDFAGAARNFDIVLRSQGKAWKVWLDDGVSYYHLHRYSDARRRFARALDLSPRSGRAHFWLGMTYRHLHSAARARGELALAAHSRDIVVRTAAQNALAVR